MIHTAGNQIRDDVRTQDYSGMDNLSGTIFL